jgi:hypothetical protein
LARVHALGGQTAQHWVTRTRRAAAPLTSLLGESDRAASAAWAVRVDGVREHGRSLGVVIVRQHGLQVVRLRDSGSWPGINSPTRSVGNRERDRIVPLHQRSYVTAYAFGLIATTAITAFREAP